MQRNGFAMSEVFMLSNYSFLVPGRFLSIAHITRSCPPQRALPLTASKLLNRYLPRSGYRHRLLTTRHPLRARTRVCESVAERVSHSRCFIRSEWLVFRVSARTRVARQHSSSACCCSSGTGGTRCWNGGCTPPSSASSMCVVSPP